MFLPGSLLKALVPRVASAVSVRVVSAALNHLLAQHPNARRRLAAHQDKRICIGLDTQLPRVVEALVPQPELWFVIDANGALRKTSPGQADAKLLVKPSMQAAIDMTSSGTSELARHLRVEGDVLLAGLLGELIQGLRWDFEDDLSRVVGDIPARRVGQLAERVGSIGQRLGREFGRRTTAAATGVHRARDVDGAPATPQSGMQTEHPSQAPVDDSTAPLLARSVFEAWRDEVEELSRRVEAIEAKTRRG